MTSEDAGRATLSTAIGRFGRSVGAKLFILIFSSLLAALGILGFLNISLHREHLESAALGAAERMSDVMKRSTAYHMMRNDRDAIAQVIRTTGEEPGIHHVRIFNPTGEISFSTHNEEQGSQVDKSAEACFGCHAGPKPLVDLERPQRFKVYEANGERVIRVINPILNSPGCSQAECHAHPAGQRVLGVLDAGMSLAKADEMLASSTRQMALYSVTGILVIALLSGFFVFWIVERPVLELRKGTERLAAGDLGHVIPVRSGDELGELAESFNEMSHDLRDARAGLELSAKTLEDRVKAKTTELQRAHEQMIQAEKLASLGKLAAIVAHEINNPLSGILTYSRLMRKWIDRGDDLADKSDEMRESLALIESESRRCGDIVKNLLMFARAVPMNVQKVDVNAVLNQCVRLVHHKLELSGIALGLDFDESLPEIDGDPAQLEQLFLIFVMNAIDAMPHDGVLRLVTKQEAGADEVTVIVEDNGVGIPEGVRARLFEPFVTTKEQKSGIGLGLAIARRVIERHAGTIEVKSEVGKGTSFVVTLPIETRAYAEALAEAREGGTS
jgi:two-component system NtrC family sensor kinase